MCTAVRALPLQHFVQRSQSRSLYRTLLRVARQAPREARAGLAAEIRREFAATGSVTDQRQHAFLLAQGRKKLAELEQMLHLTSSNR